MFTTYINKFSKLNALNRFETILKGILFIKFFQANIVKNKIISIKGLHI